MRELFQARIGKLITFTTSEGCLYSRWRLTDLYEGYFVAIATEDEEDENAVQEGDCYAFAFAHVVGLNLEIVEDEEGEDDVTEGE